VPQLRGDEEDAGVGERQEAHLEVDHEAAAEDGGSDLGSAFGISACG
jgi:hypothetical protein